MRSGTGRGGLLRSPCVETKVGLLYFLLHYSEYSRCPPQYSLWTLRRIVDFLITSLAVSNARTGGPIKSGPVPLLAPMRDCEAVFLCASCASCGAWFVADKSRHKAWMPHQGDCVTCSYLWRSNQKDSVRSTWKEDNAKGTCYLLSVTKI